MVRNTGDEPAGASSLAVTPDGLDRGFVEPVPALEPGERAQIVFICGQILDPRGSAVAFPVTAVADEAGVVEESNEDDNSASRDVC